MRQVLVFRLPGLSNLHDADRMHVLLSGMTAIQEFSAALDDQRVTLSFDTTETHLNDVLAALYAAGFEVPGYLP